MKVDGDGKVNVVLGGEDNLTQREQWILEGRQRILAEIKDRGGVIPDEILDDVNAEVLK